MYDPLRAKTKIVLYTVVAFLFGLGMASGMGWTNTSVAMPTVMEAPQVSEAAVKPAMDLSDAFVNLAEVVTPAVVRIESRRPVVQNSRQQIPDAFRRFFDVPEQDAPPSAELAGGSGFIISADGYILTNNHVVEGADQIRVYLADRRYYDARLIGNDPFTDVAVVKIDADAELTPMSVGDSDQVKVGEWVLAIGNPGFGSSTQLDYTVTAGIVSARGRSLNLLNNDLLRNPEYGVDQAGFAIEDFIQTDAVINPGNSGGPMVNLKGQVVGINSAIASPTGYYTGYGFAIPINLARRIMQDLIEFGVVKRPLIGVTIANVGAEDAELYGLPKVSGVLVQGIRDDGPAVGKLLAEDVIVALDDEPVGYVAELQAKIAEHHPGDNVKVTVFRNKRPTDVMVRLDEAPINERPVQAAERTVHAEERLGIRVESLDGNLADRFGFSSPGGVVISEVARTSPAARRTVLPGLKLVQVNDTQIETPDDVRRALDSVNPGEIVSLHVEDNQGAPRVINVRMPQ
ncbi:MAG TPA: trypsin-like peptidase domain-containing protein [Longimicrobiales bacterium]|nr:trypsin-like peptidase domain-containing protein [Longimicrobiales bacterium]